MVDWSKYDAAAREEAEKRVRLREITQEHVKRLEKAGVKPDATSGVWMIGTFPNGYVYYLGPFGDWYIYVEVTKYLDPDAWQVPIPRGPSYKVPQKTLVEPPLLDEEGLALELAKHYLRVTGK
ncbi:hypothetical protein [Plantactinospora sp. WMMB782]|uniref:hypothetical protein n=1 Tax=Plantactinospora sp. WMMB782 TaxID=3404121 RepID=UPI003B94A7BD